VVLILQVLLNKQQSMKTKKTKTKSKTLQPKMSVTDSGIYGVDATKSSVKVVHGSELTGIVK